MRFRCLIIGCGWATMWVAVLYVYNCFLFWHRMIFKLISLKCENFSFIRKRKTEKKYVKIISILFANRATLYTIAGPWAVACV